jgi:hypothetical protein
MNDLTQFQPAFNGINTLLAVSTNIETDQITNGNLSRYTRGFFLALFCGRLPNKYALRRGNQNQSATLKIPAAFFL